MTIQGRALIGGEAQGAALVLDEPLSLWGGVEPESGVIVDAHHPQRGASVSGRVLVMPAGRGSSSSSSVLAEMVRLGTAPSAILVADADLILAIGAEVARELYGSAPPILEMARDELAAIADGDRLTIGPGGSVRMA
jgi:predicted aconitase with swiveling domain